MQKAGNRENLLQLCILHIFQGLFYIPGNSTCPYSTIIEELSVRAIEAVADKDICCVAQPAVSILPMFSDFVRRRSRSNVTQIPEKALFLKRLSRKNASHASRFGNVKCRGKNLKYIPPTKTCLRLVYSC